MLSSYSIIEQNLTMAFFSLCLMGLIHTIKHFTNEPFVNSITVRSGVLIVIIGIVLMFLAALFRGGQAFIIIIASSFLTIIGFLILISFGYTKR